MLPLFKKRHLGARLTAVAFAALVFAGCNNSETKTEEEAAPLMEEKVPDMLPSDSLRTDSLPIIDTTASTRPEQRKT